MRTLLLVCLLGSASSVFGQSLSDASPVPDILAATETTTTLEVPFQLAGHLICVEAMLEGKNHPFILDTGAPTLIINSKFFVSDLDGEKAVGLSGGMHAQTLTIQDFTCGNATSNSFEALVLDISHLETLKKQRIKGLIGLEPIKEHELMIDYQQKVIRLFQKGESEWHQNIQPVQAIPFIMVGHIPVIKAKIGKKKVRLGIDTGAEVNVLSEKLLRKLRKHTKGRSSVKVQGISKDKTETTIAGIENTEVAGENYVNMPYVFTDISQLQSQSSNVKIDGLLGYPFLSTKIFSINFQEQVIYIWDSPLFTTSDPNSIEENK